MSDSVTDFNTFHNFSFALNPKVLADGADANNVFAEALYYYANSDRDSDCAQKTQEYFGKGYIPFSAYKDASFFIGRKLLDDRGYTGNPFNYFIQNNIDIPAGLDTEDQVLEYFGDEALKAMRKRYDVNKATSEQTVRDIQDILSGTLTPSQLSEQSVANIAAAGYSMKDLTTARKIITAADRDYLQKAKSFITSLPESYSKRAENAYENLLKPTGQAIASVASGLADTLEGPIGKEKKQAKQIPALNQSLKNFALGQIDSAIAPIKAAFNDNALLAEELHNYDGNKAAVLALVQQQLTAQAYKDYKEGNMGTHLLDVLDNIVNSYGESAITLADEFTNMAQAADANVEAINQSGNKINFQKFFTTFVRDAVRAGYEKGKAENTSGLKRSIETGAEFTMEMLPYFTGLGEALGGYRTMSEGQGRALASLSDEQGLLPDFTSSEGMQAYAKGAWQGFVDVAARGVTTQAVGRTFSKLAPKATSTWGAKTMSNYALAFAAEAGVNTVSFGLALPFMENAGNAWYDMISAGLGGAPRLETAGRELNQYWKDLRDTEYWGGMALSGTLFGGLGTKATAHNSRFLSLFYDNFRMRGIKEESITKAQTLPIDQRAEALHDDLTQQMKDDPHAVAQRAVKESKRILKEAQLEAAQKRARATMRDDAAKAALQLYGVDVETTADPSRVNIYLGGKYDEASKSFDRGQNKIELPAEDAEVYLGGLLSDNFSNLAAQVRNVYGSSKLLDAIRAHFKDNVTLEAMLSPETLAGALKRAKEAEKRIEDKAKQLMEQAAGEDGKPTMSETAAREQAANEIDKDLDTSRTLGDLVVMGKELQKRVELEAKRSKMNVKDYTRLPIASRAFVFTPKAVPGKSLRRILRYTRDASTREIIEEYGEMYFDDYSKATGATYTDTWRTLNALKETMGDKLPSFFSLHETHPDIAKRVLEGNQDADFSPVDLREIRRDVTEAMSKLMLSELRDLASKGDVSIPVWARELLDADFMAKEEMQKEMSIAAALGEAKAMGILNEAAQHLLAASPAEIKRALAAIETPTVSDFYQSYQQWNQHFAEIEAKIGLGMTEAEYNAFTQEHNDEAASLAEQARSDEDQKHAAAIEATKELEADGLSHEEAVKTVNDNIIKAKQDETEQLPNTKQDASFSNGRCIEIMDDIGPICWLGTLNIADLSIMPNFKLGVRDEATGEVNALKGDYYADHDPIRVFRTKEGQLLVISGRHRLAHAKRNNASTIIAYVYDESDKLDMRWAQQRDVEWNIRDNQATELEAALYYRGELIEGISALTPADAERLGMTRKGTRARTGYIIASQGSDALINAWRNSETSSSTDISESDNAISTSKALAIAQFAPNNAQVQLAGIRAAANKESIANIRQSMAIEEGRLQIMGNLGLSDISDMFGELIPNEAFQAFVDKYAKEKLSDINGRISYLNANTKKKSDVYAKDYETTVKDPAKLKAEKAKLAELAIKWKAPYLHAEQRAELEDAYKKYDLQGWSAAQERAKQKAEDAPTEQGLPLFADATPQEAQKQAPDLFNQDGSVTTPDLLLFPPESNYSITGLHASPHLFFKFDTAFMGSGEGAQAYGWGLYFASNLGINHAYFQQFTRQVAFNKANAIYTYKQGEKDLTEEQFNKALEGIFQAHATESVSAAELASSIRTLMSGKFSPHWTLAREIEDFEKHIAAGRKEYEPYLKALHDIRDAGLNVIINIPKAYNYQVELNTDLEHLLTWDYDIPADLLQAYNKLRAERNLKPHKSDKLKAEYLYKNLVRILGTPKDASMWLSDQGYKGIKHVDAASRHKRKQEDITYNYIIFHNEDIKITAYNESGNWSMTEGWQPYTDPEANFSIIGQHAQTWQKYANRAFIGRDDGLPRAELDDSQFFVFPKGLRNRRATKMGVNAFIETKLLDTIKGLYEEPSSGLENNRERLKYEFDNKHFGLYINADAVLGYYNATPSFNEEDAKSFIRTVKPYTLKNKDAKALRLSEVLHAPEIYEAYPELANLYVILTKDGKRKHKGYALDNAIYINETRVTRDSDLRSTLLHEVQHIIQDIEGMAPGGNLDKAYMDFRKTFAALRIKANKGSRGNGVSRPSAEIKQKLKAFEAIDKNYLGHRNIIERWLYKNSSIETDSPYYTNYDLYKRLAGEIEARNVERRADLTQAQRDAIPFNDTLDISADEAIVIQEILNYKQSQEQQGTADYSLFSGELQTWQRDPVAELGELGRFGSNIMGKLTPVGHDAYDQRITNMREALSRRLKELRHIWQETEEDGTAKSPDSASRVHRLLGEMHAIMQQLTGMLPPGYRFGLEPYFEFTTTYAKLYGEADPDTAATNLPMRHWPELMRGAFKSHFERMLQEDMTSREEMEFEELYSPFIALADIRNLREDYIKARREANKAYREENKELLAKKEKTKEDYEALALAHKQALNNEIAKLTERQQETIKSMLKAIGEMRAHRIMDKFLARVILKLDHYRKDRTLGRILRAIDGLSSRVVKNGKPIRGFVSKETYDKVLDFKRLLQLTKSEKELIDLQHANLADKAPETIISVPTFDEEGKPIEISVNLVQYNTYAGFESMTPEQAEVAAASIGSFIKEGKDAWQARSYQEHQEVENFCAPMYERYKETEQQKHDRHIKTGQKAVPLKNKVMNSLADWFNDAQFFDLVGATPGFEHFGELTAQIAKASVYCETAEKENVDWAYNSLTSVLGIGDLTPKEQDKRKREFLTHQRTQKECDITLTTQPPDFRAMHTSAMRTSLLKRLFAVSRQKNTIPANLAAAVDILVNSGTLPDSLADEVSKKYGRIGNPSLATKDAQECFDEVFRTEKGKFDHLLNINKSIDERTEQSLKEWREGKKDEAGNIIVEPVAQHTEHLTSLSPAEACYRVLLWEQADYTDMLRRQGYTDAVIDQLRTHAGELTMQYAYALRERMNARRDIIKQIYETTFGIPFPAIENYYRAHFDATTSEKRDTSLSDLNVGAAAGEGSIKIFYTRQKHNARILPHMDFLTAYNLAMKEQDTIIAYSQDGKHLGLFLNKVFANVNGKYKMSDVLHNGLGAPATAALKKHAEHMITIYGEHAAESSTLSRIMRDVGSASAMSALNARFSSLLKNVMAYFNTLGSSSKTDVLNWYSSVVRHLCKRLVKSPKELMKDPVLAYRFKGWHYGANKDTLFAVSGQVSTHGATDATARAGLEAFGALDQMFTARSAAILYDAVYRTTKRDTPGISEEALHALCIEEVAKALAIKSQPMNWRQRALNASKMDWKTAGFYFLGGEAWNTFTNCMRLFAKSNLYTPEGRANLRRASAVWLTQGIIMAILNLGYHWLTDDEEHWKKRNIWAELGFGSILGPAMGMPLISNLLAYGLNTAGRLAGWRDMPYIGTPNFFPMQDLLRCIPQLKKAFLNKKMNAWDKSIAINDALRTLSFALMVANQRPTSKTKAQMLFTGTLSSAILNVLDFFLKLGRAQYERDPLYLTSKN